MIFIQSICICYMNFPDISAVWLSVHLLCALNDSNEAMYTVLGASCVFKENFMDLESFSDIILGFLYTYRVGARWGPVALPPSGRLPLEDIFFNFIGEPLWVR